MAGNRRGEKLYTDVYGSRSKLRAFSRTATVSTVFNELNPSCNATRSSKQSALPLSSALRSCVLNQSQTFAIVCDMQQRNDAYHETFGCLRRYSSRHIFNCRSNALRVGVTTSPHKIRSRLPTLVGSVSDSVRTNLRYSSSLNSRKPIALDIATPTVGVAEEGLGRFYNTEDARGCGTGFGIVFSRS